MTISKELFVEAIKELQRAKDYQDGLNKFYGENCADGYLIQPDCSDMLIKVLDETMNLEKNENGTTDLYYFCFELDFGRNFKMGDVKEKDSNGKEIDLDFSSAESLYDYLAGKGEKNDGTVI